jgi:hypothetical protein
MAQTIYTLSKQTAEKLPGVLRAFGNKPPGIAPRIYPLEIGIFEITGEWTEESGVFLATAARLFYTESGYEPREDADDITLYAPSFLSEPPLSAGQRCNAFYDGAWQLIGGSGSEASTYAVVIENIQCPDDTEKDPNDDNFRSKLGRIKILGKEYENTGTDEEPEYEYDYCACLELAGKDDEYPEQILTRTQVKVIKAGTFDNPDYVAPDPDADPPVEGTPDEPEKLDWYAAVETCGGYSATLDADLLSEFNNNPPITATITTGGDPVKVNVHSFDILEGKKIPAGEYVLLQRFGDKMQCIGHPCPVN